MEVIRDDMSTAGLRRVHLMDGLAISLEMEMRWLDEGWELVEWARYEDDLGFWHLHLYYRRLEMTTMQVCRMGEKDQDYMEAMRQAVGAYERKFGRLPNTVYVGEKAVVVDGLEVLLKDKDGEVRGRLQVRRVGWMLPWDVGVCESELV